MSNTDKLREIAEKWARPINSPHDDEEATQEVLSELTALISEHYYPKEFVEWWSKVLIETHGQYGSMKIPIQIGGLRTMDEIFEYWKTNEQ